MVTKFFKEFSGNKAAFIEAGHPATYADNIVFIKDEANNGAGACIFARGSYFGNFAELIAALAYVKGVKLGSDSYVAAQGGGFIEFVASNPSQLSLNVTEGKLTIGLTESFVKSVNDVIAEVSAIKADYLKASDKEELSQLVNDKDAAMKQYVDAEIAKVASSEAFTELEGRVSTLEGEIVTERGRIDGIINTTIPALGQRITDEAPVTMETAAGEGEILNVYTFKQNGKTIGTINTRKELVVTGGEIVEKDGVKYLSLSIANQETPVEIPVSELVDVYTAGDYVTIGADNEISVDKAAIIEGLATDANAQSYANTAKEAAIADADGKLANKANSADVYTKEQANELLNSKANSADVYSKDEADDLLDAKANAADVYSKNDVDGLIAPLAKSADVYSKTEADGLLASKANVGDSYTKAEADALLGAKANASAVYTKGQVDTALEGKADKTQLDGYYTKDEVDGLVSPKADKSYVDEELGKKANAATTYSKTEVDNLVSPKADKTYVDETFAKASDMETALAGKVDNATLGNYCLKSETYTQAEVQAMFDSAFAWERIEA